MVKGSDNNNKKNLRKKISEKSTKKKKKKKKHYFFFFEYIQTLLQTAYLTFLTNWRVYLFFLVVERMEKYFKKVPFKKLYIHMCWEE